MAHLYVSSASSQSGLRSIERQSHRGQACEKRGDVALQPRHTVASLQRRHDVGERACPIAQREDCRPRGVQAHEALGIEEHVTVPDLVSLQPRLGVQAWYHRPAPGSGPRSTASRRLHSTSHLNSSAATARSCSAGLRSRSVTRRSAYSASRGACCRRLLKYCSPSGSTHGEWSSIAASRSLTIRGANISVSGAATDSSQGLEGSGE